MPARLVRFSVPITILALIGTACTGGAAPTSVASVPVQTQAPADTGAPDTAPPADTAAPETGAPTETTSAETAVPGETPAASPTPLILAPATDVPGKTTLRWYCCLGTGQDPETQIPVEQQVITDFNAAHPDAFLTFEVVDYSAARDALSTHIAGGNAPDIVGPAGVGGLEAFHGQWLDLMPLIESTGFDLSEYEQAAVDFYKTDDGQIGIPFATYPSMLWYSRALFDEAELEYPPHEYGAPYVLDGEEVEWNYDTVRELGLRLTVDEDGFDATEPEFDPDRIVQYGFEPQRDDLRGLGAYFGAGSLVAEDGETVQVPDAWVDAWKYFYDGMWDSNFIMTGPVFDSDEWGGAVGFSFASGRVAMSTNFLWTTYGVGEGSGIEGQWDLAAVPAHNGVHTAPLNADTFAVMDASKNPDQAFEALTYLQGEAEETLLGIYGGMPAKPAEQDAFFAARDEEFPHDVDWQVATDSLGYADDPNFEEFMPEYNESLDLLETYETKWTTTPGLDIDSEIEALTNDLQAIWDR
jgi:multiple sugar transport system substrate-binding protein